jgi:galactokinase
MAAGVQGPATGAQGAARTSALVEQFRARHGRVPRVFRAPGRVNLIGEHTDYNDGFVLPMAIERATYIAAAPRDDRTITAASLTLGEPGMLELDRPGPGKTLGWLEYVQGTAQSLMQKGVALRGADLLVDSDVPAGAGLSASAALEIGVGLALLSLGGVELVAPGAGLSRVDLALAGQAAEHRFVGTLCGIMDQYIVALGEKDRALLIDCRSMQAELVPVVLTQHAIVICDTRAKHELASSAYNQRRSECESAVEILRHSLSGIRALRDVSVPDFDAHSSKLPEVVRKRARHVVTENARTLEAKTALSAGDLTRFGALMAASHASLRDDYEVSCRELDLAVEIARGVPGVLGARMTGGGFGGCTVNLVEVSAVPALEAALKARFSAEIGRACEVFVTRAAQGASELAI